MTIKTTAKDKEQVNQDAIAIFVFSINLWSMLVTRTNDVTLLQDAADALQKIADNTNEIIVLDGIIIALAAVLQQEF